MKKTVLVGSGENNLTFCIQDHFYQCETIYNLEGLPVTIMFLYDSLTGQALSRSCPVTKY